MKTIKKSFVVQAALAGLFAAVAVVPAFAHDHEKKAEGGEAPKAEKAEKKGHGKKGGKADASVHCLGVNACKGASECGVEGKHGCKGANACKGQGWISLTKKDCKKQKGTVQSAKAEKSEKKAESKTEVAPAPAKP